MAEGTLLISNCYIDKNEAKCGGAIYVNRANATIASSIFEDDTAIEMELQFIIIMEM